MITPPLEQVLSDNAPEPYHLEAFSEFLASRHCIENLEFYQILTGFMSQGMETSIPDIQRWKLLFQNFIVYDSPREINIPCSLRTAVTADEIPRLETLQDLLSTVKLLLHSAYLEFVSQFCSNMSSGSLSSMEETNSIISPNNTSRNHSVSSNGSANVKESSWKKMGKKLKWRRSSNGSFEETVQNQQGEVFTTN
ncbi:unnamed protein product [Kuraishia capsulata CBS 1993]|uniref:RGS domain-containing protein n=1 Tax=Kuraishia capsulata CBS 1993 TaxID=1382522 RepID=W6MP02_9ASCO|nr:uncharacterized protein KUCA_T00004381001 [Kuraishia capsulata CBS 1993]CDK28399.1 unnamed protein product [Kuraishia capsulata CBS 1993]